MLNLWKTRKIHQKKLQGKNQISGEKQEIIIE